jgi:hypothetical protein
MRIRRSTLALVASVLFAAPVTPLAAQKGGGLSGSGAAASAPHRFAWVLDATFEYGGDPVVEVTFTDGSSQKITAGQGGTFSFGTDFRPTPHLGLRTTVGWKFATSAADNVTLLLTRVPVEAVASYYFSPNVRLGVGASYHAAVNFDGGGLGPNLAFDPAAGATVELGWKAVALTYTSMTYTDELGSRYNAGNVGVSLSYLFGKR